MINTYEKHLEIKVDSSELHLKEYLGKLGLSSRFIIKSFNENCIYLDGNLARRGSKLEKGNIIRIDYPLEDDVISPESIELDILYEDRDLLVVNKQAGLVSHPTKAHPNSTLANGIRYYFDRLGIKRRVRLINRLDRDTRGIIMVAKNAYIDSEISKLIKNKTLDRRYLLEVEGRLEKDEDIIDRPIYKDFGNMKRYIDPRGKESKTIYRVLERYEDKTLVEARLVTGRSHQIRVHFSSLGHPIIGDRIYGGRYSENGLSLKSYYLSFIHPINKERLRIKI